MEIKNQDSDMPNNGGKDEKSPLLVQKPTSRSLWYSPGKIVAAMLVGYSALTFALATPISCAVRLHKRARWTILEGAALAGVVIAASNIVVPTWSVTICLASSATLCQPLVASIAYLMSVVAIAAIFKQTGGQLATNHKRDLSNYTNT